MHPRSTTTAWLVAFLLWSPALIQAQQRTPADDNALMQKVAGRLFAAARQVDGFEWPTEYLWPPELNIDPTSVLNAYAHYRTVPQGDQERIQPQLTVNQGWLDTIVQGSEGRLAEVMGHELSHILLRHITNSLPNTPMLALAVTRNQESAADMLGFKIALKANFAYDDLIASYLRELAWEKAHHRRNTTRFKA